MRPWLVPMKYVGPWMIFVMVVGTSFVLFLEHGRLDPVSVGFLLLGWLVCLPGLLAFLVVINREMIKKGEYFKVDTASRTLELCRAGRTFKASEIIAFTLLARWYRRGVWSKTYQTGVLVRAPGNRVELYPVVREIGENVISSRQSQWADRLSSIFQVPIRQVELSRSESQALNDC